MRVCQSYVDNKKKVTLVDTEVMHVGAQEVF